MRLLDEEAQHSEETIVSSAPKIEDLTILRKVLREGIVDFEQSLKELSSNEREKALCDYLNKIRKVTFGYHIALTRQLSRDQLRSNPTPETLQTLKLRTSRKMESIARLFRFI